MLGRLLSPLVAIAGLAVGCFGSKDTALFNNGGSSAGTGQSLGGSPGAQAGTDSGSGGTDAKGGTEPSGGQTSAGSSSAASGGLGGGATAGGGAGGSAGQGTVVPPTIEDCAMLESAHTSELNGHCYRVEYRNLTFEGAKAACYAAGGHLVTIGSKEENELVQSLHEGEHWIGATDGRSAMTPGVGPYDWVTGEAWTYSEWEDGQPNAYEVDCAEDTDDDTDCFEHCAFQSEEGDWLDRSCWHTIVSVCEWDVAKQPVEPEPGAGGAGGAGGADGGGGEPPSAPGPRDR